MVLDSKTTKQINDFIYLKPRTVAEVAAFIEKNWRTADRYLKKISEEEGSISLRTFREGSPGALKIAFWNNIEKIHSTSFQNKLFKQIEQGRSKKDFSPFDIYQYVDEKNRNAFLEYRTDKTITVNQNLIGFLRSATHEILHFSGNNSWINLSENNHELLAVAEELAKNGIKIKIISRVEITGLENIRKLLAINERIGKEMIEIRHCYQPLRGFVIDNKEARFREEIDSKSYKDEEFKGEKAVFYEINDDEWVDWLRKIFFNLYRTSISAVKRIEDMKTIHKINH
ncbi:MAG: hypothetical protein ABIC91_05240 [Nanoarchaeota archaeon]|nr:hypothetical protein [Nanoarchaeota archaeon]MBU1030786.1 hypothetical protein [Nanoarchaeota archaeon]MBU1849978.1 hypothetical protein [Nanoarchaeota archaeon]